MMTQFVTGKNAAEKALSDAVDGGHEKCQFLILDVACDRSAPAAMLAYADSCQDREPHLAAELRTVARSLNLAHQREDRAGGPQRVEDLASG